MAKRKTKAKVNKGAKCCSEGIRERVKCYTIPYKTGGCFYFLGFLGSVIYYLSISTGFWNGVLGILKSLVWPAFLIFELLKFISA